MNALLAFTLTVALWTMGGCAWSALTVWLLRRWLLTPALVAFKLAPRPAPISLLTPKGRLTVPESADDLFEQAAANKQQDY